VLALDERGRLLVTEFGRRDSLRVVRDTHLRIMRLLLPILYLS
jgi:hypothetical protein